jgi:hypothetical protein
MEMIKWGREHREVVTGKKGEVTSMSKRI